MSELKPVGVTRMTLPVGFRGSDIENLLITMTDLGVSDIKIQSGDYITVYYKRQWFPLTTRTLEHSEVEAILAHLAGAGSISHIGKGDEVDKAPEFFRPGGERQRVRFRLNAIGSRVASYDAGISMTLRSVPQKLPEIAAMKMSEELTQDMLPTRGIVFMVGPTGSGKTTTIAACINERLKECPGPSIITYENPPEFAYDRTGLGNAPLVSQAHIGEHLKDWSRAGPTAMRRKADIILMGEVRQADEAEATMEMGITGHMVYSTLHADTPNEAIYRLVEMFPEGGRSAAASKLLGSLRVLCAQKLIKTLSGNVVPLRSWITFDAAMKDDLTTPEWPYAKWPIYVRDLMRERGTDFASQCIPLIAAGEINTTMFRDITQCGRAEAESFCAKHSAVKQVEELV